MSNNITLADIHAAAEKKYGNLTIAVGEDSEHEVVLRNVLRLTKTEREELYDLQSEANEEAEEGAEEEGGIDGQLGKLRAILRKLCATDGQANKLLDSLGDDLPALVSTFDLYKEATQMGEASRSQS